jgi:GAF domain-containing protein
MDKADRYRDLAPQLDALFEGERDLVANLANAAAAIKESVPAASWVGFYRRVGDELVLGPFQGKVACVRIAMGRGVCGTAAATRQTLVVPDVHEFAGHIACDAGARSEVVIPIIRRTESAGGIIRDGEVLGVLDLDSYELAAFDEVDARALEAIAAKVAALWSGDGV